MRLDFESETANRVVWYADGTNVYLVESPAGPPDKKSLIVLNFYWGLSI